MPALVNKSKDQTSTSSQTWVSPLTENYLLCIYELNEDGFRVTLTHLAEQLRRTPETEHRGTSLPSVAGMVRRMQREGLVQVGANKDLSLTPEGVERAASIARRHRLAERMVADLLGMDLYKSHIEAHRLEHAISPEMETVIAERLGYPTTCPFGHPIPGSAYSPDPNGYVALNEAEPGRSFVLDRIPEYDSDLLEFLVKSWLIPGQTITVKEVAPFKGVITLQVDDQDVVLGYEAASQIWLRKGSPQ